MDKGIYGAWSGATHLGPELPVLLLQTLERLVQEVVVDEVAEGTRRLVPFYSVTMETQGIRSGSHLVFHNNLSLTNKLLIIIIIISEVFHLLCVCVCVCVCACVRARVCLCICVCVCIIIIIIRGQVLLFGHTACTNLHTG